MVREREFLPWYRKPSYRGRMTEEQKKQLDVIRDREIHPAVTCDQLPNEAQSYINELEMEAYDAKQQALAGRTIALSAFGAYLIDANFLHFINFANWWSAIVAGPLLVLPWISTSGNGAETQRNSRPEIPTTLGLVPAMKDCAKHGRSTTSFSMPDLVTDACLETHSPA